MLCLQGIHWSATSAWGMLCLQGVHWSATSAGGMLCLDHGGSATSAWGMLCPQLPCVCRAGATRASAPSSFPVYYTCRGTHSAHAKPANSTRDSPEVTPSEWLACISTTCINQPVKNPFNPSGVVAWDLDRTVWGSIHDGRVGYPPPPPTLHVVKIEAPGAVLMTAG